MAYVTALNNKWLDEYEWMKPQYDNWTKEECYKCAKKCLHKKEFRQKFFYAWRASLKNGWIKEYTWLRRTYMAEPWTKDACEEIARKYTTQKDFRQNDYGAYSAAYKHGWLKSFDWLKKQYRERHKPVTANRSIYPAEYRDFM